MKLATIIVTGSAALLGATQMAAAADGKQIYDKTCASCHAHGIAGAAKLTDKDKWAPLVKQGADALTATVIKGKGVMPPRGGNAALSDAEVRAAVDYIIEQVK